MITGTRPRDSYDIDFDGYTFHQLDVADADAITDVARRIETCHVLVNNAGGANRDPGELTPEGFAATVEVNLLGVFRMSHALFPKLAAAAGRPAGATNGHDSSIINIASMMSYFGSPRVPAYAATKGGVVQLTKSLAQSWAPDGVRVNAIAPGWIETNLTAGAVNHPDRSKEIVDRTPLGRWGTPDELAGAALFLASDGARFITGTTLDVDGGYHIA